MAVYATADLRGSDHKPGVALPIILWTRLIWKAVYGIFRARVRIVDVAKRTTLSRLLLDSVLSTEPGEILDQKLASLSLPVHLTEREWWLLTLWTD